MLRLVTGLGFTSAHPGGPPLELRVLSRRRETLLGGKPRVRDAWNRQVRQRLDPQGLRWRCLRRWNDLHRENPGLVATYRAVVVQRSEVVGESGRSRSLAPTLQRP